MNIKNTITIAVALAAVLNLHGSVETRAESKRKKAQSPAIELKGASISELNRRLEQIVIRHYPPRTANLTPEQISAVLAPHLVELRAISRNIPANHILHIYGHTSAGELPTAMERRRLSKMRAWLVHSYLKHAGIPNVKMIYMGIGSLRPAETPARSRRVGFRIERSRKAALVMNQLHRRR